jgi:hypothetical protein
MKLSEKTPAQRLADVLNMECPDEEVGRVLRECLTATTTNRAGVVEPDFKVRLAACQFVTQQRHGLPVRREEILQVNVDADSAVGMEERLRSSPALRSMFRKMLERVDGEGTIEV